MNAEDWKKILTSQLKIDHKYIPSFNTSIAILSQILEERDRIYQQYLDEGAEPVIIFVTDRGQRNPKPNPLLRQWHDLTVTALQYLRDLGLTAAGLRKLQGSIPKEQEKAQGSEVLERLREMAGFKMTQEVEEGGD